MWCADSTGSKVCGGGGGGDDGVGGGGGELKVDKGAGDSPQVGGGRGGAALYSAYIT